MMALYDQIQELRAELAANTCAIERALIESELAALERAHADERAAFATELARGDRP